MSNSPVKIKSPKNKTITISTAEKEELLAQLVPSPSQKLVVPDLENQVINGDLFTIATYLPKQFVDLLIIDPPYNLSKNFGAIKFKKTAIDSYTRYVENFLSQLLHTLKPTASIYICGDWHSSCSIYTAAQKYFTIRNRITWQREKGRGAQKNWKNAHEDIWFATMSDDYIFHLVKTRKKALAPYRENGQPKDWQETENGKFRDTYPANFWDDITIPYWSMPENTEHPTQKPEKLLAKLILASSDPNHMIFDPFAGSGTSCVVAKKLGRRFLGIEIDENFACVTKKRLNNIQDSRIQGYADGVFWERNTLALQKKSNGKTLLW